MNNTRRLQYVLTFLLIAAAPATAQAAQTLTGPAGNIKVEIDVDADGRLVYSVLRPTDAVVAPSPLGIVVDSADLGLNVTLGRPTRREIKETYAHLGVKAERVNHCIEYLLPVTPKDGPAWMLEVRVFDDGAALRYHVPGKGTRHIEGEATAWRVPKDAPLWCQHETSNYEGEYYRTSVAQLHAQADAKKKYLGPPVTIELPGGGYALITEACLYGYSGMTLRVAAEGKLQAAFQDDADGWKSEGEIVSPWRVTVVAEDLNALVNTDLINSLGEVPDPKLFPQGAKTEWIRPGKGICTWAVFLNDGAQWHRQKWFIDKNVPMGCEYLLVDGGWRSERWGFRNGVKEEWTRLKELCDYAKERGMGIFVWNAYPEGRDDGPGLTDPARRTEFLRKCKEAGVVGVKIDFFDTERKDVIDVYEDILRETAEHGLMLNLHGTHKPTGETRTWPHEITREGLREQEYVLWSELGRTHYGAMPFTRMVAGHGDFLPGFVRPKYLKNTTAVFQLATTVVMTSPFLCWPDHPDAYLDSPALSFIRTVPTVWDETRVLKGSKIGQCAAFARRSGGTWYVGILNTQDKAKTYELDLSFLGNSEYLADLYYDQEGPATAFRVEAGAPITRDGKLSITMRPGGGFVGRFRMRPEYQK